MYPIETALSYNNIGIVYQELNKFDEALDNFKNAMKIQENILGFNHAHTVRSYQNIANVYNK